MELNMTKINKQCLLVVQLKTDHLEFVTLYGSNLYNNYGNFFVSFETLSHTVIPAQWLSQKLFAVNTHLY